jgi:hypothetical protein
MKVINRWTARQTLLLPRAALLIVALRARGQRCTYTVQLGTPVLVTVEFTMSTAS